MHKKLKLAAIGGVLLLASGNGLAADDDFKHWSVDLGVFLTNWDTNARLDASGGGLGTNVDFENTIGLDQDSNAFRVDAAYRFNHKHRLDFTYFRIARSSTATLSQDISWGDQFFPMGSSVSDSVDIDFFRLAYTYSLWHGEWGFFGLTGGLHLANIKVSLNAPGTMIGQTGKLNAPLPVVGFLGEWNFHPKWTTRYGMQIFKIDVNGYDGSMYDSYAAIDYELFKNADIGLGYNWVSIDIDTSRSSWRGKVDWDYGGPLAYVHFRF